MKEYSTYPWGETYNNDLGLWGETYNYDYAPTSGFDSNGLLDEFLFNNITSMNPISTPGQLLFDDFSNCSYTDDEVKYLYAIEAPFKPFINYPVNPSEENQSFSNVEVAQPMAYKDTSNSTLENPRPVFPHNALVDLSDANPVMSAPHGQLDDIPNNDFSYPDETKPFITEKAQGLPKPCLKTTSKPSKLNEVTKVVSAAEFESDQWVWKKYGTKYLKGIERERRYYKCEMANLEDDKCEAKIRVNESCSVPNAYDVIYIGNHNHGPPTHTSYPTRKRTRYVKIKKEEECWSN